MVRRLELDERPLARGLRVDGRLQVERGRLVGGQRGGQPAERRRLSFALGPVPQLERALEAPLAERDPDAPVERLAGVADRDRDERVDEEVAAADDAGLAGQLALDA